MKWGQRNLALYFLFIGIFTTKKTSIMDVSQAGVTGFEPVFTVLETVALPLNYTPLCLSAFVADFYILSYEY